MCLAGLLAACKEEFKKGQPTKSHMLSVCYMTIAGLPAARVSRTKDMKREANTEHMSDALTSLDMPLGRITWCLVAPDRGHRETQSSCALERIHTWTCDINIPYLPVRAKPNQFNACYLERDLVRGLCKKMPRVTCRDLDPACRVSAQGEISWVQGEHIRAENVISQRE